MTKRLEELSKSLDRSKQHDLQGAAALVKKCATAKFDETVELHIRLGIDPKQSDQQVRGTINLPHGTGKTKRVAVLAKGEKQKEAQAAKAEAVGADDLIERISKGFMDFDVLVATPDIMREVTKLGKILGPRGLMPNPKSGTVTFDIAKIVQELKTGRVEFKADDSGIVHLAIGKASFPEAHIAENARTILEAITKAKPAASKGTYIKSISLCSTMGPAVAVDATQKY
ncbi:MAG: 50S ribosomal protein L1 [Elusimicrobia bacterium]|nr:50S ribosomal protein L1 [Elusimicrobiota bacterium]